MKNGILVMGTASLLALLAGPAEALRCGNKLIVDGDPKGKVADLCGKPTHTEARSIIRSGIPRPDVDIDGDRGESVSDRELAIHTRSHVEVVVDVWLYNFGKSRLMREIVFRDNRVVEVNVLGRGY